MSDILVTGDLHLRETDDHRLDVLEWICELANEKEIDVFLVAGDLFDSDSDARSLQSDVQTIFDDELSDSIEVVMIAGNHDENLGDLGWSASVKLLEKGQSVQYEIQGESVFVHGLPYRRGQSFQRPEEIFSTHQDCYDLLLSHASFLTDRHRHLIDKILESNEENAFVVHEDDFRETEFDQIILGHWHGHILLGGDPPARYVGSPMPNSIRETETKGILLGEMESNSLEFTFQPVATPPGWRNVNINYTVLPGYEENSFRRIKEQFPDDESGCVVNLNVDGYTEWDVERYRRELEQHINDCANNCHDFSQSINVQTADSLDFPLVDRLLGTLNDRDPVEDISLDELDLGGEPDRVYEEARSLLQHEPEQIEQRAKELMMGALVEVLEG